MESESSHTSVTLGDSGAWLDRLPPRLRRPASELMAHINEVETVHAEFLTKFIDTAFSQLLDVPAAATFLADLYEGREAFLVRHARVQELIQEMSSGQAMLTCMVAGQWVADRDMGRLTKLADAILATRLHISGQDCLDLMSAMAGSIAFAKPQRGHSLLNHVIGSHENGAAVDLPLLEEAKSMVGLASVVVAADASTRALWEERLRRPDKKWEWNSPEERQALRDLADWLLPDHPLAEVFERVVPAVWWDLWLERCSQVRQDSAKSIAAQGELPLGWGQNSDSKPPDHSPPSLSPSAHSPTGNATQAASSTPKVAAPDARSPRGLLPMSGFIVGCLVGALALAGFAFCLGQPQDGWRLRFLGRLASVWSGLTGDPAQIDSEVKDWMDQEIDRLSDEVLHIGSLETLRSMRWADKSRFLTGATPELPLQSQMYRKVLMLLHLVPPADHETRAMVPKLLLSRSPDEDLIQLWERCFEAKISILEEVQAAAKEALDQPALSWNPNQRKRLEELAKAQVKKTRNRTTFSSGNDNYVAFLKIRRDIIPNTALLCPDMR